MALKQIEKYLTNLVGECSKNIILLHDPDKKLKYISLFVSQIIIKNQIIKLFSFESNNIKEFFIFFENIRDSIMDEKILIILSISKTELFSEHYLSHIFTRVNFLTFSFEEFLKTKYYLWSSELEFLQKSLFWFEYQFEIILKFIYEEYGNISEILIIDGMNIKKFFQFIKIKSIDHFINSDYKKEEISSQTYLLQPILPITLQGFKIDDFFFTFDEYVKIINRNFPNINSDYPENDLNDSINQLGVRIKSNNAKSIKKNISKKNTIHFFTNLNLFTLGNEYKRLFLAKNISDSLFRNTLLEILLTKGSLIWFYKCVYENLYSNDKKFNNLIITQMMELNLNLIPFNIKTSEYWKKELKNAVSWLQFFNIYPKKKYNKDILELKYRLEKSNQKFFTMKSLLTKKKKKPFDEFFKNHDRYNGNISENLKARNRSWLFWVDTKISEVGSFLNLAYTQQQNLNDERTKKVVLDKLWDEVLSYRFPNATKPNSFKLNYKLFFDTLHLWDNSGVLTENGLNLYQIYKKNGITSSKFKYALGYIILTEGNYYNILKLIDEIQYKYDFYDKGNKKKLNKLIRDLREEYSHFKNDVNFEKKYILPAYEKKADNCWLKVMVINFYKSGYGKSLTQLNEEITRRFSGTFQRSMETGFYLNPDFKKKIGYEINWNLIENLMEKGKFNLRLDFVP